MSDRPPVMVLSPDNPELLRVMEGAAHLDVPLVVDTGSGDNWDEAH